MIADIKDKRFKEMTAYRNSIDEYLSVPLTEADTRAKFIDVFIKQVLGWGEDDLRRERLFWTDGNKARIDYEVGRPRPLFLVEAKRISTDFELPDTTGRHLYKLDGVIASCHNLWAAIVQARNYCDEQGIPFAVVSNGRQFALFRAISPNRPWREGNVFVFSADTIIQKHFIQLHDALCVESASVISIDIALDASTQPSCGSRIADNLGPQVGRLSNRLSDVMEETLGAILRDQPEPTREFLEHCYATDPSVDYYAKSLQGLLRDPIPFFSPEVASVKPGHKKDPFGKAISALMDRQGIRPPVVIIGGKGFGKTTFLQWFLKASAFNKEIQGHIVLWIDFRPAGFAPAALDLEVRKQLIAQLENSSALCLNTFGGLKEVFRDRIDLERKRFLLPFIDDAKELEKETAKLIQQWQSDVQGYLLALMRYAVDHCKKRLLIVLDNADQKPTDFQIAVYNTAQQLAAALPITLMISLRESTFYRLCKLPQGDAFSQQQVFHIRAPNVQSVLNQRFEYLAEELKRTGLKVRSASGVELSVTNIEQFVRLLQRSILEGKDAPLITEMLAAVSNGSIRETLNLVHEFLVSGHTKMEDYIWQYAVNKKSSIPFHEFLASVMLDEMAYFREDYSHSFINIFARSPAQGDSHFTRLRILHLIRSVSPGNEYRPDDYVKLATVRSGLIAVGVPEASIDAHLQTLIRFGLVHTDTQTALDEPLNIREEYERVSAVHIAAAGQYYLDTLCSRFQYLQRIIPDVPITDEEVAAKLNSTFMAHKAKPSIMSIQEAVETVDLLVAYLERAEQDEVSRGVLARNPVLASCTFMGGIRAKLAPQRAAIENWMSKKDT